jgi:hypothetical protein
MNKISKRNFYGAERSLAEMKIALILYVNHKEKKTLNL